MESNEDKSHSMRLREVQNATSPHKGLTGHTKGEIAIAWYLVFQLFMSQLFVEMPIRSNVILILRCLGWGVIYRLNWYSIKGYIWIEFFLC